MTQVTATVKNIRIAPEKVNLIVAQIRTLKPQKAIQILSFLNKSSSSVLAKLIKSAIANARQNQGLNEDSLSFKEIYVTKGPFYKRYQPVSRGRAHHILKRTSHVKIILESKTESQKPQRRPSGTKS